MSALEEVYIDLIAAHALTAPTATYENNPDPQTTLRRGLIEETAEYVREFAIGYEVDKDQIKGEIGDVLWYLSEISRSQSSGINGLDIGRSLDEFQAEAEIDKILPIIDYDGSSIDFKQETHVALAVTALRVVDVLNPKNDDLWIPGYKRTSLSEALGDFLTTTSFIASNNSVLLSDALKHTIDKLSKRERKPHVIDEVLDGKAMISGRQRLNIHPFVGKILLKTILSDSYLAY